MIDNFKFKNTIGKFLIAAFFIAAASAISYGQSNNLYYQSNGSYYGRVTVYSGSHFSIVTGNSEIKTYRNSCRGVNTNGVAGVYCTFGQFSGSRLTHSGDAYFYQNGTVYLRWLYEFVANQQRSINSGWYGFRP